MIATYVLSALLAASALGNALLWFKYKTTPQKRGQSVELQEFLADLMSGYAIVAVSRIDPGNILMRSPRART